MTNDFLGAWRDKLPRSYSSESQEREKGISLTLKAPSREVLLLALSGLRLCEASQRNTLIFSHLARPNRAHGEYA